MSASGSSLASGTICGKTSLAAKEAQDIFAFP
jgi:hypothetical protein